MYFPKIGAAVLFVDDLDKAVMFYRDTLGFPVTFNDSVSYAFKLEDQDFVLLKLAAAAEMVGEAPIQKPGGQRVLLCAGVDNVDEVYKTLTDKGVTFIKPPISQPWGRRTTYFADPDGNLWELYQMLTEQ